MQCSKGTTYVDMQTAHTYFLQRVASTPFYSSFCDLYVKCFFIVERNCNCVYPHFKYLVSRLVETSNKFSK